MSTARKLYNPFAVSHSMRVRSCKRVVLLLPLLALLLAGCRTTRRTEPLEADNRKKEIEIRELREKLDHSESVNNGLMREIYGVHGAMPPAEPGRMPPVSAGRRPSAESKAGGVPVSRRAAPPADERSQEKKA